MQKTTKPDKGIYCLVIESKKDQTIIIPKFKNIQFPAGFYYYIGSAQKNMYSRIERHLRKEKKIHWHIDYLTSEKDFEIVEYYTLADKCRSYECEFSQDLFNSFGLKVIVLRFGSSDCTECKSHLYYRKKRIPYSHLFSRYQSIERFIPSSKRTF